MSQEVDRDYGCFFGLGNGDESMKSETVKKLAKFMRLKFFCEDVMKNPRSDSEFEIARQLHFEAVRIIGLIVRRANEKCKG